MYEGFCEFVIFVALVLFAGAGIGSCVTREGLEKESWLRTDKERAEVLYHKYGQEIGKERAVEKAK